MIDFVSIPETCNESHKSLFKTQRGFRWIKLINLKKKAVMPMTML